MVALILKWIKDNNYSLHWNNEYFEYVLNLAKLELYDSQREDFFLKYRVFINMSGKKFVYDKGIKENHTDGNNLVFSVFFDGTQNNKTNTEIWKTIL